MPLAKEKSMYPYEKSNQSDQRNETVLSAFQKGKNSSVRQAKGQIYDMGLRICWNAVLGEVL